MEPLDCVVVGYAGVDRIIRVHKLEPPGVTMLVQNSSHATTYFGGNGSNIAYCMGRLGLRVHPLMRVGGADEKQLGYLSFLQSAGVETGDVDIVPNESTSICHLVEDDEKNHLTMTYPGAMDVRYATREYPDEVFLRASWAVLSVATYADAVQFLQKVRKHGTPLAFAMRADYESFPKPILRDILLTARLIFMNEVECALTKELLGLEAITDLFRRGRAEVIVVTLGANGSTVYQKQGDAATQTHVAVTPGKPAVDATGAGDSYVAGFLYGMCRGYPPGECAAYGSTVASFIIEQTGCLTGAPDKMQMLERHQKRGRSK